MVTNVCIRYFGFIWRPHFPSEYELLQNMFQMPRFSSTNDLQCDLSNYNSTKHVIAVLKTAI